MEQHKFLIRCDSEILDSHALYVTPILPNIIGLWNHPPPPKKKTGNGRNVSTHTKKQDIYKRIGFQAWRKTVIKGTHVSQLIKMFKCNSFMCGLDEAFNKLNSLLVSIVNTKINLLPWQPRNSSATESTVSDRGRRCHGADSVRFRE